LKLLLEDIKDNAKNSKILVTVFDDGGNERFAIENYDIKYIKYAKNNGKRKFWKVINDTFKYVKNIDAKYFFYLQDDNRLTKNFFEKSIKLYKKIDSSKKFH
jgi:stalled ribosome rescue protein Dom34